MIHVVLDTNVIVSAFITKNLNAPTSTIWMAALQGKMTPVYNDEIIEEYKEVLSRKKFNIPISLVKSAVDRILLNGMRGDRIQSDDLFPDPDDVVFYEVALSKEETYLVTGNTKHFPKKPIVVTPSEMVEILMKEGVL